MMQSAASSFMEMNQSHDEMNSSDIEEELDLALEENMSLLSLSNGRSKISPSDTSLDLSGFFSDEDEIFYEETVDYTVGCNKSDYMKSMSDPGYLDIDDNVRALETRSPKNNFYSVQGNANSSIYATGASVFSGYSSPPSGNKVKSPSQPIDIVYGREERDYRRTKSSGRLQRNLFCDTKARREDWREKAWERKRDQVLLEGFSDNYSDRYIKTTDSATEVSIDSPSTPKSTMKPCSRSRNLTNVDLDELKGCLDLGFGFNYEELPELSNTLPALELCYAIGQKFQDDNQKSSPVSILDAGDSSSGDSYTQSPIANWKISSPGDHPQQVKARLKVWAQAVACTVRLCS